MEERYELNDIADNLLIINRATIERLFQEENKEIIVLYMFYYKTAKWQKHNPIKASDEYTKMCLHWGTDKVKNLKKRLKDMELIEVEKRLNEKKQVVGWYIKLNYYESTSPISTSPTLPLVAKQDHKILLNNNINTINNINTKERNIRKKKPTLEEVEEYVRQRNSSVDAKRFFEYYEVGNWEGVKNWKQKLITWESHQPKKEETSNWVDVFNKEE